MSKSQLIAMARDGIAHAEAGTIAQAKQIFTVPASHYYDQEHWELEVERIFKRLPLMLATSAELPAPGDYKAMEAAGLPVLITRDKQGDVQAYVNSCKLDVDVFLSGYDEQLANFNFKNWHHFGSRRIDGPNWKIAYDGYLDFYHLPILHKETKHAHPSGNSKHRSLLCRHDVLGRHRRHYGSVRS